MSHWPSLTITKPFKVVYGKPKRLFEAYDPTRMKTRRESQRIIRRACSCGELDAAGTQTTPKVSGFVTAAGQVTDGSRASFSGIKPHWTMTSRHKCRKAEVGRRNTRLFSFSINKYINLTDKMSAAAAGSQPHSPGQRSSGSRQRGAEQPSPWRAGLGFPQPGRAAGRPPTEASAAEPSSPLPRQTQRRTFSSSRRGSSCVAHAGVIESEQQREMSTGEWRHEPRGLPL